MRAKKDGPVIGAAAGTMIEGAKVPLHVRIREAFSHLGLHHHHHHQGEVSSGSSDAAKTIEGENSPSNTSSASTAHSGHAGHRLFKKPGPPSDPLSPADSQTSVPDASPIAIPQPHKHRGPFWGLFGKRLEREVIVASSIDSVPSTTALHEHGPATQPANERCVGDDGLLAIPLEKTKKKSVSPVKLDGAALEVIREHVPDITDPSEIFFPAKYRFINSRIIGKGASGVIRLAYRREDAANDSPPPSDKWLAVKEFRKRRRDESQHDYLRKIAAEYCIATTMHHQNVIETLDFVQDKDKWYEVMEYCPGGDLFAALPRMDDEQVDSCFKELVEGVTYLHSLGVAHRDLKPENILIDRHGHARITDFGVSDVFKVVWERLPHKSRGVCGSSPYIAPEEYNGAEYDAQKVDVWSLGIIYLALVFHSVPWEEAKTESDANFAAYCAEGGHDAFEPFQRLPRPIRNLLKGMLEVDPGNRLSIEQVRDDPWLKRIAFVPLPH